MKKRRIIKAVSFTLFVFSLLGWLYIALAAIVRPETISVQLGTFGIICFALSFVSFLVWNIVRESFSFNISL